MGTSELTPTPRIAQRAIFALKYFRVNLFYRASAPVQQVMRARRMASFVSLMNLTENAEILDLGGQPKIWSSVPLKLNITILNLPGIANEHFASHHNIRYVVGDACNVAAYADRKFDIVFSNSVIEHVGDAERQAQFAHEVRRLGRGYWVQTPSKYFPIEAHTGMPFWWFYSERLRQYLVSRWRLKLPAWTEMIEATRVLKKEQLRKLFPQASIKTERLLGISKSYIAYRVNL